MRQVSVFVDNHIIDICFDFLLKKVSEDCCDSGDILVNKTKKTGGFSCFLRARVTPYSLIKDRLVTT